MALKFLKTTSRLFCGIFLTLGLMFFHDLIWLCIFGMYSQGVHDVNVLLLMILTLITWLRHFLHCKSTTFPLIVNKSIRGDTLTLCKYSVSPQIFIHYFSICWWTLHATIISLLFQYWLSIYSLKLCKEELFLSTIYLLNHSFVSVWAHGNLF